jgi:transglutaminase-like putative cysteine protease
MRCKKPSVLDEPTSRRDFLRLAIYGCGAALAPIELESLFADSFDVTRVQRMEFDVSYTTKVLNMPKGSKILRVWIPAPPASNDQIVENFSVSSSIPHEIRRERVFHNKIAFIQTDVDAAPFSVVTRYRIIRSQSSIEPVTLDENGQGKYLSLTPRVKITDDIRIFADKVAGKDKKPITVGRNIYNSIIDILSYDKTIPGCGTGDTEWIYKNRRGKCDDYHSLFMAMMISRSIPVRWEQGFPLPYPSANNVERGRLEGDCSGAHCWASFYDRDLGWIPVDVSEADKHPELADFFFGKLTPNRFKISEGRNIILEPGQSGGPLNSLAYAYAEADGIPLIYKANYENTIEYEVKRIELI